MGSNMAEAHPVGFQWVMEAKARGARVIHVDPRFTRTSALADQHVTVRAGTDIAFLERFHYMLRVVKPSSPMSVGTWILTPYGAGSGLAAAAELLPPSLPASMPGRLLHAAGRPAGLSAAVFAPGVASYTAALLAQTAVPAWHEARRELPFVFTGSAAASGGGLGMLLAPVAEAGPARRLAAAGAAAAIAIRTAVYFRRDQHLEPFIVQAVWLVGTLAALLISARRLGRGPAQ
jgi:formate-dependent nitrite reductase membrane component NrfD